MVKSLEQAEARARRNGYRGAFPPPPRERPADAAAFDDMLTRTEQGDQRANLVAQLAVHACNFFDALPPERFSAMADTLIAIAEDEKTARRVKIRAVQAAIRPIIDLIKRVRKLQATRTADSELLAKLERSVAAFMGRFAELDAETGHTKLVGLADGLFTIATSATGPKGREDQVRAIDTALRIVTGMMDALLAVKGQPEQRQSQAAPPTPAELRRARAELAGVEDEIEAELRGTAERIKVVAVETCEKA